MNASDPWLAPLLLLAVIGVVCGLLAIGAALVWLSDKIPQWRRRRRRLRLMRSRQVYDSRFENSTLARDWKHVERATKGLREAA